MSVGLSAGMFWNISASPARESLSVTLPASSLSVRPGWMFQYETLHPGAADDQAVVIYTAEPGTPSHTALQLLSTLAASKHPGDAERQLPGPLSRRARGL